MLQLKADCVAHACQHMQMHQAAVPTSGSELRDLKLEWVPRLLPRAFGKVLSGELQACKQVRKCGANPPMRT